MEGSSTSPSNNNNTPITTNSNWQPWPEEALTMARTALDLTRQDWSLTGQTIFSPSPTPSSTTSQQQQNINSGGPPILPHNIYNHPTLSDLGNKVGREEIVERMVSLLFVRIVALVTCRLGNTVPRSSTSSPNNIGGHSAWDNTESLVNNDKGEGKATKNSLKKRRQKIYTDYSTTTICKAALQLNNPPTPPTKQENTPQQQLTTSCMDAEHSHDHDEQVDGPMDKGYHSEPGTRHELNNKKIKNHRRASDNPPSPPTKNDIYGGKTSGGGANEVPPSHLLFPSSITPQVIQQLRHYVKTICNQYHTPSNVPYHNVEHAYHVFLSANKLLDLMLCESPEDYITPALMMNGSSSNKVGVGNNVNFITSQMGNMAGIVPPGVPPSSSTMAVIKRRSRRRSSVDSTTSNLSTNTRHRPTFGLKSDPLSQLAYLFSALVHDVDHTGISNRQLVLESDDLAILYNDQSVAEQRSLAVAFTTLKKNAKGDDGGGGGYKELREVLFPEQPTPESEVASEEGGAAAAATAGNEDFFKFRKLVIDLVLVTDIASPERTQIVKSKWKEAFGDVIVAEKLKKSATQQLQKANKGGSRGREYFRVDRNKVQTLDPTAEDETPQGDNVGNGSSNTVTKGMLAGGPKLIPTRRKYNKGSSGSLDQEGRSKSKGKSKSGDDPEQVQPRSTTPTTSNNQRTQYSSSLVSATDSNCDSIYFDSSDSSLSDMNSLDDDFDASAVSRTKMNFDSLDASTNSNMSDMNASDFNSSGTSGGDNINRRGSDNSGESNEGEVNQVSGGPVGTKANRSSRGRRASQGEETTPTSTGGSGTSGCVDPLSKRWSTGDLTDDVDLNSNSSSPQQPKSPRGRAISSSNKVNQNYTVSARTSRPSTSKSFTISSKTSSGSPSNSRRRKSALSRPLSQSMVSNKDLRRARPRAHSEERRLGVRRALDLAGSTIIAYNNLRGSFGSERNSLLSNSGGTASGDDCIEDEFDPDDDVDEFKATVVLEQMIRAADVAALLQDWNNTMKWSTRLYKELKNGYLQNRGEDPTVGWFENQIKFFDFYILPLAKNLGVMGVFEESVGSMFVYCVKSTLARWIEEGSRETELMIKQDADERKRSQEGQQSVNSLSQEVVSMGINEGDKVQPPPALSNGDDSQPPPR